MTRRAASETQTRYYRYRRHPIKSLDGALKRQGSAGTEKLKPGISSIIINTPEEERAAIRAAMESLEHPRRSRPDRRYHDIAVADDRRQGSRRT